VTDFKLVVKRMAARVLASVLPRIIMNDPRLGDVWSRAGFHVVPRHYYSVVPDLSELPDSVWDVPTELVGIDMALDSQLRLLESFESFADEYARLQPLVNRLAPAELPFEAENRFFGPVDAESLYCMLRTLRPKKVIEVGSGESTRVSLAALAMNGDGAEFVAVEPYPSDALRLLLQGRGSLLEVPVQDVPNELFSSLTEDDVLFIDSTHVVRLGSDVVLEILEVLPRLRPGVVVHFHDIFLPSSYPREWPRTLGRYWTEQYLLQAFLAFNEAFSVVFAAAYVASRDSRSLKRVFPTYSPARPPGSFWIRRDKGQ
jgi:predicted O-methyltransferase YrrM